MTKRYRVGGGGAFSTVCVSLCKCVLQCVCVCTCICVFFSAIKKIELKITTDDGIIFLYPYSHNDHRKHI